MNNQEAYQVLEDNSVFWGRIDENTIYVYTSGYKTAECYEIEKFLMKAKMFCLEMRFDRHCGQTKSVYRHQKED